MGSDLLVSTRCKNTLWLVSQHSNLSLNEKGFEIKPLLLLKYLTFLFFLPAKLQHIELSSQVR